MSERSSKRRKLDSGASALPEESSATAKLAELRRSRQKDTHTVNGTSMEPEASANLPSQAPKTARARRGDVSTAAAAQGQKTNGTTMKSPGSQRSQNAEGGSLVDKSENKQAGSTRSRRSHVADEEETDLKNNDHGNANDTTSATQEDVEMQDAPSVITDQNEGSVDLDTRRTSGRKRQISKKLEEAQMAATTPAKSSPAPRARATPNQRTPSGSARKTKATGPASAPRSNCSAAAKKRTLPEEIPDSEPESEKQGRSRKKTKPVETASTALDPVDAPLEQPQDVHKYQEDKAETVTVEAEEPGMLVNPDSVEAPAIEIPRKKVTKKAVDATPVKAELQTPKPSKRAGRPQKAVADDLLVAEDVSMADTTLDDGTPLYEGHVEQVRTAVTRRLTRKPPKSLIGPFHTLVGLDAEYQKVSSLVEQTVTAGESNSMVLIGARGSGKSALVDNIIREQRAEHGDDFHVVRLSGFIHTDDKIAIREIWRQLGREMEIENDSSAKNYADTLTTLLALLSHPSETGQDAEGRMAKSVVIILDEFDLFTTHPRQTLLYNLFDIAQSRKAPIAVLGLTTRFDVSEALEKRVKSRFSHRQVYLPLAKNFTTFKDMCQAHLTISPSALTANPSTSAHDTSTWNHLIAHLFTTSTPLNTLLQQTYHTTKSVPAFLSAMLLPISTLSSSPSPTFTSIQSHLNHHLTLAPSLQPPSPLLPLLTSLSTLQLSLLIAAARLVIIHDTDAVSFPLAYDEYKSLASKARIAASASGALAAGGGARVWGQRVARTAWEGLVEKGLVVMDGGRGGTGRVDVSLEEVGGVLEGGGVEGAGGLVRWCKEI
ncbi:hypothetical protein C1H76_1070 [Elsinoe australis]|uniref:Origin recognition complex subunit 4 n=1 Tax=Elsinoe australis TaxID=40998 RepID=A0A4U7B573_9PEZI|nr:hypothetical protein C1H76_1070 [Elsinoe australis]